MFLIELTVKTPLVIGSRVSKNWYAYTDPSIINGRMLWGTILSKIAETESEMIQQEHLNPSIAVSSLIYVGRHSLCIPSHPFNFTCKTSNEVIYTNGKMLYDRIIRGDRDIMELIREKISSSCRVELKSSGDKYSLSVRKGLITPVKGLVEKSEKGYVTCGKPKTVSIEMVAIDKGTRSAKSEMLFTYEAVPEGTKYYSLIVGSSNRLNKILDILKVEPGEKITFRMGRGVSRGYGVVDIVFYEKSELLDEANKYYSESLSNGVMVLYSLSPVIRLGINGNNGYSNIPVLMGLSIRDRGVYSTGTLIIKGWSRLYNTPTPTLRALAPGTVIVYEVKDRSKLPTHVGELIVMMQRLGGPGVNFLIPLQVVEKLLER